MYFPSFENLNDTVVAVVVVAVGDEDVAIWCDRNVARRTEVIGTAACVAWNAEPHHDLSLGTELDDLMPAFVTLRNPVRGDRVGDPDVPVLVDVGPCGQMNVPPPKLRTTLPSDRTDRSNWSSNRGTRRRIAPDRVGARAE